MRNALFFCLLALACACGPEAPAENDAQGDTTEAPTPALDLEIHPGRGFGPFTEETAKASMIKTLKSENVIDQAFYLGEGETAPGLLLYPGTPREVEVLLDEDNFPLIYRVQREDSAWRGPQGLKIGTTLAQLVEMNGQPFRLTGFGWDYGGTITNWNGGTLAHPGFMVVLGYQGELRELTAEDTRAIMGDQEISSTLPALTRYPIEVVSIEQRY